MKPVTDPFITLIRTQAQFAVADLYDFQFLDGSHDYFTNIDLDIIWGGNLYKANSLRIEGLKYKIAVGWQVDEQQIKISAFPGETLGGASFFGAVENGLLDGAILTRMRGFWTASYDSVYLIFKDNPTQVITLFTGLVSTIDKIGRTHVELKLKSPLKLLDIDMPRNTYQPGCQWRLYDQGCTIDPAGFTTNYTVNTADSLTLVGAGGPSPAVGPDGFNYFAQGRIIFTSGVNNNLEVSIRDNDATRFYLQFPLVNVPAYGDTFNARAGCSKTANTCALKFSNFSNFRGFPRVPSITTSV